MKKDFLMDIRVKDALSKQVFLVPCDTNVEKLNEIMLLKQHEEVLVVNENNDIVGIITRNDLAKNLARGIDKNTPVSEIMTKDVIFMAPEKRLLEAKYEMRRHGIGRAPVLDEKGKLLGLLTAKTICDGFSGQLDKAVKYFDLLARNISTAVCVLNKDHTVTYYNDEFEELFRPSKVIGITPEDFMPVKLFEKIKKGEHPLEDIYFETKGRKFAAKVCPVVYNDGQERELLICIEEISNIVNLIDELDKASLKLQSLEKRLDKTKIDGGFNPLQSKNQEMIKNLEIAREAALSDINILIMGEIGTGKKYLAALIHELGPRRSYPMIKVNCNMPSQLLEVELFGQARDDTGNIVKTGQVENVDNGTLLLEEIGELSKPLQQKVLRLIKDQCYCITGSNTPNHVNVRIIATSSQDLGNMVAEGSFNSELYEVLGASIINIPPLRKRSEDIVPLMKAFIDEFEIHYDKKIEHVDTIVMKRFMDYEWPQNVYELKNVVERLVILSKDGYITEDMLPKYLENESDVILPPRGDVIDLEHATDIAERKVILDTLKRFSFNKTKTAKALKISRSTLYNKLKQYGLET